MPTEDPSPAPLSIRAYARRRGVSHTAVRKAMLDGRIGDAVRRDAAGRVAIDPLAADALWEARTDPAQARSGEPPPAAPAPPVVQGDLFGAPAPAAPPPASTAGVRSALGAAGDQYRTAAALKATYDAQLRRLELEERTGKLVLSEEVRLEARARARALRERLLAIPDRVAAELALETDPTKVRAVLLRELRGMLQELADVATGGFG